MFDDPSLYKRLIGKLLYLIITKPNLSYAVNRLSQFLAKPRIPHYKAVQRVLQYIKGTPRQGLFYPANPDIDLKANAEATFPSSMDVQLLVFSDEDWGTCSDTR